MATIIPREPLAKINWFETRDPVWSANAAALGTSTTEISALTSKTAAARAAYNAQQLLKDQAKAATEVYHAAVRAMNDAGTDVVKKIKAKAAVDGDSVYALALIPSPATPAPIGPPGPATDFTAELDPTGVLNLTWKSVNPPGSSGTIYQVARQIGSGGGGGAGGGGGMVIIGSAGQRKFADATIPAGTDSVTYQITPIRSTVAGPTRPFTVKFGGAAGAMTASIVPSSPKLAA